LAPHFAADFKAKYSDAPWPAMKRMRNIFIHPYAATDIDLVWEALINNVPVLKEGCEKTAGRLRNQEEATRK
jgi:uncharacterized protein with HEPN domain